jgi:hypothetical protein
MLQNTNSNSAIWLVDHHGFNDLSNYGGYHTTIHQDPRIGDPAAIAGINQIYVKTKNGDTQLFVETGNGKISQLTGYSAATPGFQVAGGIIFKWGNILTSAGVTFTFPTGASIPAFTNCWNVQLTPVFNAALAGAQTQIIGLRSFSATNFVWTFSSDGNRMTSFNWLAIGS